MKVIKPGKCTPNPFVGRQFTCHTCGQVNELEKEDISLIPPDRITNSMIVVVCPLCGTSWTISK